MKLANAKENFVIPPIGRHPFRIVKTETAISTSGTGAPMIKIVGEVRGEEYGGAQFYDNMITDDAFKGAGFGKKKLRGLGVNVDSTVEISDQEIANNLLGLEGFVDLDHEQIMDESVKKSGNYDTPRWNMENGVRVPANKLVVKAYYVQGAAVATPGVQTGAPVLQQAPVQGQLFQGQAPQAQLFQPQAAIQAPQQFQGYAQPQLQAQPQAQQFIPQGAPQFIAPQTQAIQAPTNGAAPVAGSVPPWVQQAQQFQGQAKK